MDVYKKFQNKLQCVCNNFVIFEIIDEIECDWGIHTVIQCPKCEELFSLDKKCPAFGDVLRLLQNNALLLSKDECSNYLSNAHPS